MVAGASGSWSTVSTVRKEREGNICAQLTFSGFLDPVKLTIGILSMVIFVHKNLATSDDFLELGS